jgi:hypothetical protein
MLGKKQSDDFKEKMVRMAAARREYATRYKVSARKITKAMLIEAGLWH